MSDDTIERRLTEAFARAPGAPDGRRAAARVAALDALPQPPRRARRVLRALVPVTGLLALASLLVLAVPRGDSPTGAPGDGHGPQTATSSTSNPGTVSAPSTASVTPIPTPSAEPAPSRPVPTAEAIDPALRRAFSVFRRAATSIDRVPSDQTEALLGLGANPSLARAITVAGARGFLVPTTTGLCLTLNGSGGCTTTEVAVSGALVGTDICGQAGQGQTTVYGLLPDGAGNVVLHFMDGSSEPVPLVDNAYGIQVPRTPLPSRVTWAIDGRERDVAVPGSPGPPRVSC